MTYSTTSVNVSTYQFECQHFSPFFKTEIEQCCFWTGNVKTPIDTILFLFPNHKLEIVFG